MTNNVIEEDIKNIAKDIADISHVLSGKTILIAGGAGFLGNYFIGIFDFLSRIVLEKPCKIISLDNFI